MKRRLEGVLWPMTAACAIVAGRSLHQARHPQAANSDFAQPLPRLALPIRDSISAWSRLTMETNPFRFTRAPASVAFGEASPTSPAPTEARPRPALALLGTIGGPPWQAVVAGLPGRSGTVVVRPGQQVDSFLVRAVNRERVVIAGPDTTWILTVRQPWK